MCCLATSGGTGLPGGWDGSGAGGGRSFGGACADGASFLAQALNSPWMARWIMPNKYPAGLRMPWLLHRAAHSSSTACPSAALTCCNATRSEAHTSELQSLIRISYAVICLKKQTHHIQSAQD